MTLKELYDQIGASYDQATRVLRMDKLIDKHIRKFPKGGVADALLAAGKDLDPTAMFETSHALKGVCSNLGLVGMAELASEISEEFRPGKGRQFSDAEIHEKLRALEEMYKTTTEGIRRYEESL